MPGLTGALDANKIVGRRSVRFGAQRGERQRLATLIAPVDNAAGGNRRATMPFKVQVGPQQVAIHHGQTVLVSEPDGQINWPSEKGLYFSIPG